MKGSRKQEAKNTELQRDDNGEKSNHDEGSQSEITSVTQQTETTSGPCGELSSRDKESGSTVKEEEEEKPLEGITATKGKKKKKRKKKKTDFTSSEPASIDPATPTAEEADVNEDPSLPNSSKPTCAEECEKNEDPLESSSIDKKRKKKKKKKKKTQAVTNSELSNVDGDHVSERDIESNSENPVNAADPSVGNVLTVHDQDKISTLDEVTLQTDITVQDHEDLESMKKETLELYENNHSNNEGNDAVVLDSGDVSGKSSESTPEESTELFKEGEDYHASEEKDRSCSPENMGPEATAFGVGSHKASESTPFEGTELVREGDDFPASEEEDRICPPEECPDNESLDGAKGTEAAGGRVDLMEEMELSDEDNPYVKLDHEGYVSFFFLPICNMWKV